MTISGPPSTLKQLLDSAYAFGTTSFSVPIGGPYHAHHLHSKANIQRFLLSSGPRASSILDGYHLLLPIISSSTGTLFDPSLSTRDLLSLVIRDIVSHPLQLEKILDRCVDLARTQSAIQCTILSFSPSLVENSLLAALRRETNVDVSFDQPPTQTSIGETTNGRPSSSRKSKIAIVGMAGRFPNAADHEKFWELLEAGLDVHKKASFPFFAKL